MSRPTAAPEAVVAMMTADSASRAPGISLIHHRPGWAVTEMVVGPDMVNGHRTAHGGVIFAVAAPAFACACNSWGPVTVAAGCEILFIAPARIGDVLQAQTQERTRFGRSGIYDVPVRRGTDVIAEFRGRSHQPRETP